MTRMILPFMLGMLVLSACSQDPTAELRQWAEQGDVHAQYNLGDMYENRRGVPQDYREAVRWYRAAAEQGLAKAQYNLGVMCEKGTGTTQDDEEAVRWYLAAAEQGYGSAQNNLGYKYENGQGVTQDFVQADKWYILAGSSPTKEARDRAVNNHQLLVKTMTPDEIAEAQRLAREWKPKSSGSQ